MNDEDTPSPQPDEAQPRWEPIGAIDRRLAGVLVEKAKTTPDVYPLSLNAIRAGCNQKSNRHPVMTLELEDIEESVERLRLSGAVGVVEGYGRVSKYRHYLYEWLGVDKVELAVMAELLLRGPQTEGALRGRAARMEPIADLTALRPVLASLKAKGLVLGLTPEGRGHLVTHALYRPQELDKLRAEYAQGGVPAESAPPPPAEVPTPAATIPTPAAASTIESEVIDVIRRDLAELRAQLAQLRSDMDDLLGEHHRVDDELRDLKDSLGG